MGDLETAFERSGTTERRPAPQERAGLTAAGVLHEQLHLRHMELVATTRELRATADSLLLARYDLGVQQRRADDAEESRASARYAGFVTGVLFSLSTLVLGVALALSDTWHLWRP